MEHCQCTVKAVGYATLAYIGYKLWKLIWNVLYPYYLASPKDLKKLAGAEWAGKIDHNYFIIQF